MEEIWRDIYGYDGLYQVSNYGRVYSFPRKKTKGGFLKLGKNKDGYLQVFLSKNGNGRFRRVHTLVAQAFIPNEDIFKTEINHKDECKTNNFVFVNEDGSIDESKSNIEWCTHKENINYGTHNERMAKTQTNRKDLSKQVNQYSKDGKTLIKTWISLNEIQRQLGLSSGYICDCCNGKHSQAYGFRWEYA